MGTVKFTVLGEPKGKGRPRFSTKTGRAFTPKQTVNYETLVQMEYISQCGGIRFPDDAMIDMHIKAFYAVPKSDSKKKKELKLANVIRPMKKPDQDNIVKIVADSLNQLAYKDDTQIVDCKCQKFYSSNPRIEVELKRIGGDV